MKTSLTYGAFTALASALLVLLLFFLGYHTDPTKFATSQKVVGVLNIAIGVTGIILGIRARRAEVLPEEPFGYGRALGTGILVAVFAALFGSIFQALYQSVINPGILEVAIQHQVGAMQAQGRPESEIEQAEKFIRMMSNPGLQVVIGVFMGALWGLIVSLIAAAFLRRRPVPPSMEPAA